MLNSFLLGEESDDINDKYSLIIFLDCVRTKKIEIEIVNFYLLVEGKMIYF